MFASDLDANIASEPPSEDEAAVTSKGGNQPKRSIKHVNASNAKTQSKRGRTSHFDYVHKDLLIEETLAYNGGRMFQLYQHPTSIAIQKIIEEGKKQEIIFDLRGMTQNINIYQTSHEEAHAITVPQLQRLT